MEREPQLIQPQELVMAKPNIPSGPPERRASPDIPDRTPVRQPTPAPRPEVTPREPAQPARR